MLKWQYFIIEVNGESIGKNGNSSLNWNWIKYNESTWKYLLIIKKKTLTIVLQYTTLAFKDNAINRSRFLSFFGQINLLFYVTLFSI